MSKKRKPQRRQISSENEIRMFMHCGKCMPDRPDDQSPEDWARLNVGWTELGIQVWCRRCEANLLHVDFEGQRHPANTERIMEPGEKRPPIH